ncbi:hypothetical protein [Aquibacillus kalidii]|uniref:hypothetical protein n=1 Tax=Aquibacillus kalidii TaxID=2762597 RepID=UPI00164606B1|nr:hypothetical protein [Aquibacillus kalidii]
MTDYNILEDDAIIYYVYNLNWLLPEEVQEESIRVLSEISPDKVDLLIPKYGKECWANGVYILNKIGYPKNKKALTKLAQLLQDRNWPGALETIELFRGLGKEISTPYIEIECEKALQCNDADWLEHLYFACDSLNLTQENFCNKDIYIKMKQLADELD